MNRLEYWMKAPTQYNVHSPFVFEMYRKVLFAHAKDADVDAFLAQLPPEWAVPQNGGRVRRYLEMVYKMQDHYRLRLICLDADEAVMEGDDDGPRTVKVVFQPHHCRARELRWTAQQGNAKYNVSIDLYDVGILMFHPKLHKQYFILR